MDADDMGLGCEVTVDQLIDNPYPALARLRSREPVSWVPATGAWFVTRRDLAIEVMTDPDRFTVDDDRFTTARVLGTSMLSLDGEEHQRHRRAFAGAFRPKLVREQLDARIVEHAERLMAATLDSDMAELRSGVAGPLAVATILDVLGLPEVDAGDVLAWYDAFSEAIVALTLGQEMAPETTDRLRSLHHHIGNAMGSDDASLVRQLVDDAVLRTAEIPAAVAVVMFGAIETSEAMTANAFWHLLTNPDSLDRVRNDRSLLGRAIDESLRLEPAAAVVDRYTTDDVELGGITIPAGELVTISLLSANRDPSVFPDPDRFDLDRPNLAQHVTWAAGPHTCLGLHVARAETRAALHAFLDAEIHHGRRFTLDPEASSAPRGLIFRKPPAVVLTLSENL